MGPALELDHDLLRLLRERGHADPRDAVKLKVRRRRPELEDLPPLTSVVSDLSFPSAHATTSFAAAAAYSRALPLASPLFYGAATLFAVSRPYLGVHYPSDVLAGAALGTLTGRLLRCR